MLIDNSIDASGMPIPEKSENTGNGEKKDIPLSRRLSLHDKKAILLAVSIATFMVPFMSSMTNLSLPMISDEFSISAESLGWVSTAYLFMNAMALVPVSRLSDIIGRKKVFLTGAAIMLLSMIGSFVAPTYPIFIVTRMTAGVGAACMISTSVSIITAIYEPCDRGSALGINTAFMYGGLSLGPVLGGIFTGYIGWRVLFLFIFFILIIGVVLFVRFMKEEIFSGKGEPMDRKGTVLYIIFVFMFLYGLILLPSAPGILLVLLSLIPIALFIHIESKSEFPVMDVSLFLKNKVCSHSGFAAFFNYGATYAISFFLSLYLQSIGQISAQEAGFLLLVQPLFQTILSSPAGKLSSKPYGRYLPSAGIILIAAGLLGAATLDETVSIPKVIFLTAVLGAGYSFFAAPNTNILMGSVDPKDQGKASGILASMRQFGMVFSMAIAMSCITWFIGDAAIDGPGSAAGFLSAMRTAFVICAILCLFGAVLSYTGVRTMKTKESQ